MSDPFARFDGVVENLEDLRTTLREPMPSVVDKVIDHIDDVAREIIAKAPFVVVASATAGGYPDISPKGDPAGFVQVLDEKTIAIPDRPGNRRVDTFRNLFDNPYLALLFLIPGKGETLRVTGECRLVRDEELRASMAIKDRLPDFAVVMHVERVLIHCPKCVMRSHLWVPEKWPDASETPDVMDAMIAHADLAMTKEDLFAEVLKDGTEKLY